MELEDKKFLAKRIGWERGAFGLGGQVYWLIDREPWTLPVSGWNPDTDHKHFAEVWNKLTSRQQKEVVYKCVSDGDARCFADMLLLELPKVMDKVLEILKGE